MLNRVSFWCVYLLFICVALFCKPKSAGTNNSPGNHGQHKPDSDTSKFLS